jgi:hypothetical protein
MCLYYQNIRATARISIINDMFLATKGPVSDAAAGNNADLANSV